MIDAKILSLQLNLSVSSSPYSAGAALEGTEHGSTKSRRHYSLPGVRRFHRRQTLKPANNLKHSNRRNSFTNIRRVSPSNNKDLVSILEQMLGENNSQLDRNESEILNHGCGRESLTNDKEMGYRFVETLHIIIQKEERTIMNSQNSNLFGQNAPLIFFKFREVGTQTSNTFESALGILKDAINHPSFINETTYLNVNKHISNGVINQSLEAKAAIGTRFYNEKMNLFHPTSGPDSRRKTVFTNGVLPFQQPVIRPDISSQFHYNKIPATQYRPSSFSLLCPQASRSKVQDTNKQYGDIKKMEDHSTPKCNASFTLPVGTFMSKNELKSYKNTPNHTKIISNKLHPTSRTLHPRKESTPQSISASIMPNLNLNPIRDAAEIDYLELRTYDPVNHCCKTLPIKLPSPLITKTIALRPINTAQFNHDGYKLNRYDQTCVPTKWENFSSSRSWLKKWLVCNEHPTPYFLKACQFSWKGCDGLTRYSKVDFCQQN